MKFHVFAIVIVVVVVIIIKITKIKLIIKKITNKNNNNNFIIINIVNYNPLNIKIIIINKPQMNNTYTINWIIHKINIQ
jgi:hypothetical protein